MKNEKLIQAARKSRETQYEAPCLANGAAHSEDYSRRVERLIKKADKSRLSFLYGSGAARVAAAALALVIVAAACAALLIKGNFTHQPKVQDDENAFVYYSGDTKITVKKVKPLESPINYTFEWMELSDEMFKRASEVVIGTITEIDEISVSYDYMEQGIITDYYSLLTVSVNDTIIGEFTKGKTVQVLFELSSHRINESNIYPKVGKEYVFFLCETSTLGTANDYSPIAEYVYCVQPPCFVPIDEPQDPHYLEFIGAEEEACGEELIEALKNYYK
jgi:hypothetical protein